MEIFAGLVRFERVQHGLEGEKEKEGSEGRGPLRGEEMGWCWAGPDGLARAGPVPPFFFNKNLFSFLFPKTDSNITLNISKNLTKKILFEKLIQIITLWFYF